MTELTFRDGIKKLFAASNRKFDEEVANTYWEALKKMNDSQFTHAVKRSVELDENFPRVPKLWAYAREIGVSKSDDPHFTFTHLACGYSFAVRKVDVLSTSAYFRCEHCFVYDKLEVYFKTETMAAIMQEAQRRGGLGANLDTDHEIKNTTARTF